MGELTMSKENNVLCVGGSVVILPGLFSENDFRLLRQNQKVNGMEEDCRDVDSEIDLHNNVCKSKPQCPKVPIHVHVGQCILQEVSYNHQCHDTSRIKEP